ncbi:16S rRNA (uracil(1498)-N(3))-methyltransferase [Frigoribacterium faeni]|uniref:Ribosomal RNA small subunit methyltransferase E n=1 Tax=Frigoribacterium faeni TaxID=145483 RepID=A0A7W3PI73_9MICO|nr:16S rRNA (uracil(1498)-N(3))-methyltransferase [Frigoribacterium faeni]MBA8812698.1 16S rRNA (uracil1498-N3)-methyltransferase [Frigoribacterium faeni]BFF13809.1 16S rRNA (uracil(1498)-N(3))-methyltransferase [Microbacterium flavescens]GEK82287.1 ribosomal RNA small subunit methyltransferase E [Frigoribacterium faeni]
MAHSYLVEALDDAAIGGEVVLGGAEARHAVTVSRLRVGDPLRVGNGRGLVVDGTVQEARADRVVMVASSVTRHPRPDVTVALVQALAKGDRDELAVQAATELGVDEVVPWSAARSISRWEGAKVEKGLARWRAITREATKQAVRPWGPVVGGLVGTKQLAARARDERMLVLEPTASTPLSTVDLGGASSVLIVVGPEGGVSPGELEALEAAGATPVRLGDSVLRTSTAGPAALAVLSVRLGRW